MAIRSGDLTRRVTIQKRTDTVDSYGEPVPAWTAYATRWAAVEEMSASERFTGREEMAEVSHRIRLRSIAGVRPSWRVVWRQLEATTLASALGAGSGDTTATVASAAEFPADTHYLVQIEDEYVRVTGGQGTTSWTVERGLHGTTRAAHASGSTVYLLAVMEIEGILQPALDETHLYCRQPGVAFGVGHG
jgi:SPP1 family predicted phage head-tail adaptor